MTHNLPEGMPGPASFSFEELSSTRPIPRLQPTIPYLVALAPLAPRRELAVHRGRLAARSAAAARLHLGALAGLAAEIVEGLDGAVSLLQPCAGAFIGGPGAWGGIRKERCSNNHRTITMELVSTARQEEQHHIP